MTGKTNVATSVAARLLNLARHDCQTLLTRYCRERFLDRLRISDRREDSMRKGDPRARTFDAFLASVLKDLRAGASRAGTWRAGGRWR
jgi:hypothetical protein